MAASLKKTLYTTERHLILHFLFVSDLTSILLIGGLGVVD